MWIVSFNQIIDCYFSSYFELDEAFDKGRRMSAVLDILVETQISRKAFPEKQFRCDRGTKDVRLSLSGLKSLRCAKTSWEQFSVGTFKLSH
jgi:hypothetical protein